MKGFAQGLVLKQRQPRKSTRFFSHRHSRFVRTREKGDAEIKRPGHEFMHSIFKMADELKVGFLGGGNMAKAIARGFITSEMVKAENIIASATTTKTLAVWKVK